MWAWSGQAGQRQPAEVDCASTFDQLADHTAAGGEHSWRWAVAVAGL